MKKLLLSLVAVGAVGCMTGEPSETEATSELTSFAYTTTLDGKDAQLVALDEGGATTNDVFQEFCTHQNSYEICVTYNFTSRTAAANVQNEAGSARSTTIRLRRGGLNGTVIASTSLSLGSQAWRGVFQSNVATNLYCSEAQNGSLIVGICHDYR